MQIDNVGHIARPSHRKKSCGRQRGNRAVFLFWIYSGVFQQGLKSDSHLPKTFVLFASIKTFKNDEKCFSFHLKSSFRSQDI